MTPEKAYAQALRRIREAEETEALELDLSGLALNRLPPELERLTSLQALNVSGCWQLRGDLATLAGLTSLQTLNLSWCGQLRGDLSSLAGLTSLQTLSLYGCWQLRGDLSPLAGLTSLQTLDLYGCKQLRGDLSPLAGLTSLKIARDTYKIYQQPHHRPSRAIVTAMTVTLVGIVVALFLSRGPKPIPSPLADQAARRLDELIRRNGPKRVLPLTYDLQCIKRQISDAIKAAGYEIQLPEFDEYDRLITYERKSSREIDADNTRYERSAVAASVQLTNGQYAVFLSAVAEERRREKDFSDEEPIDEPSVDRFLDRLAVTLDFTSCGVDSTKAPIGILLFGHWAGGISEVYSYYFGTSKVSIH